MVTHLCISFTRVSISLFVLDWGSRGSLPLNSDENSVFVIRYI